jgi:hypothetical protein
VQVHNRDMAGVPAEAFGDVPSRQKSGDCQSGECQKARADPVHDAASCAACPFNCNVKLSSDRFLWPSVESRQSLLLIFLSPFLFAFVHGPL